MKKTIFFIMAACIFFGCTPDENKSIAIKNSESLHQEVWADDTVASHVVSFSVTEGWTSWVNYNWVSLSPDKGKAGQHEVSIKLERNFLAGDRVAEAHIRNDDGILLQNITIKQKGTTKEGKYLYDALLARHEWKHVSSFTQEIHEEDVFINSSTPFTIRFHESGEIITDWDISPVQWTRVHQSDLLVLIFGGNGHYGQRECFYTISKLTDTTLELYGENTADIYYEENGQTYHNQFPVRETIIFTAKQ